MINKNAQEWLNEKYPSLTTVKEIKVEKGEKLDEIDLLMYFPSLAKKHNRLIIKDFPCLEKIDVEKGRLNELLIRNCPLLTDLDCRNNEISKLNVSGCPNLKKLICRNNRIT